jgi:hypothetical protein
MQYESAPSWCPCSIWDIIKNPLRCVHSRPHTTTTNIAFSLNHARQHSWLSTWTCPTSFFFPFLRMASYNKRPGNPVISFIVMAAIQRPHTAPDNIQHSRRLIAARHPSGDFGKFVNLLMVTRLSYRCHTQPNTIFVLIFIEELLCWLL